MIRCALGKPITAVCIALISGEHITVTGVAIRLRRFSACCSPSGESCGSIIPKEVKLNAV